MLLETNRCDEVAKLWCARLLGRETLHTLGVRNLAFPLTIRSVASDMGIVRQVALEGVYGVDPGVADTIKGKTILDLGANIGASAAFLASQHPNSRVVALEPHHDSAVLLRQNASKYGGQIDVVEAAVTTGGPAVFQNPEVEEAGFHTAYQYVPVAGDSVQSCVDGLTPEELCDIADIAPQDIGMIKMDIEGAEAAICEGGFIDELLAHATVFAVESHERFLPGCDSAIFGAVDRAGLVHAGMSSEWDHMFVRA